MRFEPEDGEIPPDPRARPLLPVQPERPALRVDEPGLLDLVVDGGRDMGGRFGMAQSGPADARAARLANALVGNDANEPLLELTVRGPSLTALRPVRIALAGPAVLPWIDGQPAEAFATLELAAGNRLSLPHTGQGARSYLAIAGRNRERALHGQRKHRRARTVGRPLAAGDVLGTAREVRLRHAHERPGRLADRRRDGAHPAGTAGHAARRSRGSTAPSCGPPQATARACASREPRSRAANR